MTFKNSKKILQTSIALVIQPSSLNEAPYFL
jgi:hypothetical protein